MRLPLLALLALAGCPTQTPDDVDTRGEGETAGEGEGVGGASEGEGGEGEGAGEGEGSGEGEGGGEGEGTAAGEGEGTTAGEGEGEGAAPCAPLQQFSFTLGSTIPLTCDGANPIAIFDVAIPASGYALARVTAHMHHDANVTNVTHFWNVEVVVGEPELAFGTGDDMCPGVTKTKTNLGTGVLTDVNSTVTAFAFNGASPCSNGAIDMLDDTVLDVFVEDPRAECRNTFINAQSWYESEGFTAKYSWATTMTPVVDTTLATVDAAESLRVLSVIEGSPSLNPDTVCGAEVASLVSQTLVDGSIESTSTDVVTASQGQGHLVLSSDTTIAVAPGVHDVALFAGSNFTGEVLTGGCCGDGVIAALRVP